MEPQCKGGQCRLWCCEREPASSAQRTGGPQFNDQNARLTRQPSRLPMGSACRQHGCSRMGGLASLQLQQTTTQTHSRGRHSEPHGDFRMPNLALTLTNESRNNISAVGRNVGSHQAQPRGSMSRHTANAMNKPNSFPEGPDVYRNKNNACTTTLHTNSSAVSGDESHSGRRGSATIDMTTSTTSTDQPTNPTLHRTRAHQTRSRTQAEREAQRQRRRMTHTHTQAHRDKHRDWYGDRHKDRLQWGVVRVFWCLGHAVADGSSI